MSQPEMSSTLKRSAVIPWGEVSESERERERGRGGGTTMPVTSWRFPTLTLISWVGTFSIVVEFHGHWKAKHLQQPLCGHPEAWTGILAPHACLAWKCLQAHLASFGGLHWHIQPSEHPLQKHFHGQWSPERIVWAHLCLRFKVILYSTKSTKIWTDKVESLWNVFSAYLTLQSMYLSLTMENFRRRR